MDLEILLLGDIDEMEGKSFPRFIPSAGSGAKRSIPGIVEVAEEQDESLIARPHRPDLNRLGIYPPGGSRGKLGGNAVAVLRIQQLDQLPSLQILRSGAEQFTDSAVRLFEAPGVVEQPNTHRGVGETTPKAFERSEGRFPLALGRQIAHN